MKSLMLLLGACVIILLLAAVVVGVQDFRSEDYTEAHGVVTTAAGVTSANITLTQDLFMDRTSEVQSVTSNLTSDVPLSASYTSATNRLLVSGLVASETRTITVVYKIGRLDDYYAVEMASRTLLTFLILGVIGLAAGAVYQATRRGD